MQSDYFPIPATWDRPGLEAIGFEGFVPLVRLNARDVPTGHGIYVVLRPDMERPYELLADNPVKRARIKVYTPEDLASRWISGTPVVYIGKAMGAEGLRDRLRPYSRKSSSHSGGRAIWQLADAHELLISWVETPNHVAKIVESQYIKSFKDQYHRGPFANVSEA